MNVDNFLTYFNGIYCDFDGAWGDQCFDLANGYSRWIGGQRFSGATADLIINQAGTFYTRIDNKPDNFPQKGDVIVWNWPHVAIATGDNTDTKGFDALEQNDPTGSDCHLKHYNYNGVLGWLRPNSLPQGTDQAILDELRKERDNNWNLKLEADAKNNDLAKQLQDEQAKSQSIREALDAQTKADATTGAELLDVSHERDEYKNTLNEIAGVLKTTTDLPSLLGAIDVLKQPHDEVVKQVQPLLNGLWEAAAYKRLPKKTQSLIRKILGFFGIK